MHHWQRNLKSVYRLLVHAGETQKAWLWLTCILLIAIYGQTQTLRAQGWVDHTFQVLRLVQGVETALINAQAEYLEYKSPNRVPSTNQLSGYRVRMEQAIDAVVALKFATRDNPTQQKPLAALKVLLQSNAEFPNARFLEIHRFVLAIQAEERRLLDERRDWSTRQQAVSFMAMLGGMAVTVLVLLQAQRQQQAMTRSRDHLNFKLRTLETEQRLSSHLLTCRTADEAHQLLRSFMGYLLPECRGVIYTINNSRNEMQPSVIFGDFEATAQASPKECWALRRGDLQTNAKSEFQVPCHLCQSLQKGTDHMMCLPLQAHEETIGLLHLVNVPEAKHEDVINFAHQIALPLAVLKLQAALEHLGFHDSLTGLYNRRFFDESLPLQIAQAQRNGNKIGIIMIDVDNFKRWNDAHDHTAGDTVLVRIAQTLRAGVRASDLPVRYGGEELMVVLPEISSTDLAVKAEYIRRSIEEISFTHNGTVLGGITVSMGTALYPQDGNNTDLLVRAADAALLTAKSTGKNRVCAASHAPMTPVQ